MSAPCRRALLRAFLTLTLCTQLLAETSDYLQEDPYADRPVKPAQAAPAAQPARPTRTKPSNRKYFTDDSPRTDAGVFHVGFAAGGNFYIEPRLTTDPIPAPTGDFYKDFGFQAGVYFDHDYSELDENIPLMLRGMVGYKYILNSVHVFIF